MSSDPIQKLADLFAQFPGIGERQSKRFVYFLLTRNNDYLQSLSKEIAELRRYISECTFCHRLFPSDGNSLCDYCRDTAHRTGELLIIEKDADYDSIRRSRTYSGDYFILGGLVPIVEKNTSRMVRTEELKKRVDAMAKEGKLKEVILAFSLNPQGEHTDMYIRTLLEPYRLHYNTFTISSLGRGLSTGTELEYSDSDTIKNALKNRS